MKKSRYIIGDTQWEDGIKWKGIKKNGYVVGDIITIITSKYYYKVVPIILKRTKLGEYNFEDNEISKNTQTKRNNKQ